jgi:hypothetical protein
MKVNMNLVVSSAILSAMLVSIPEPSSVSAEELGELILEERSSQPIASQALWPPHILRRNPVLLLNEQAIRQGLPCLRTQWRIRLTPTGEASDTKVWWVDRARGIRSQRQIAPVDSSGACPDEGYVGISDHQSEEIDRAGWGLARYRAFLKGDEEIDYRCVAEDPPFLEVCSEVEGLREWLSQKTPTYVGISAQRVWIKIDSTSDAEITFASPHRLTIKFHYPVPF